MTGQKPPTKSRAAYNLWRSGFVARWHTDTDPRLRNSGDSVGAHTFRMIMLIMQLVPRKDIQEDLLSTFEMVLEALFHDCDELYTGDVSAMSKRERPDFAKAVADVGKEWLEEHGIQAHQVHPLVDLVDKLDALLFVYTVAPDLIGQPVWDDEEYLVLDMAEKIYAGCEGRVASIIQQSKRGPRV